MRVVLILNADHRAHERDVGESIICDEMPWPRGHQEVEICNIGADLEITRYVPGKGRVAITKLCRSCALVLLDDLREALDLLDAAAVSGWMNKGRTDGHD